MSTISASTTTTTAFKITTDTTGTLVFQTGASPTTAVTFDGSQNVGVGATPSAWGSGVKVIEFGGSTGYVAFNGTNASGYTYYNMWYDGTNNKTKQTGYIGANGFTATGQHVWYNGSGTAGTTSSLTQAMTLDASGNFGLGVTPSAWTSTMKAIQFGASGALYAGNSTNNYLASNTFFNGTNQIKIVTGASGIFGYEDGSWKWFTAASGSAGATNSFTQAMTLDASGNLGIGTTSPSSYAKLAVIHTDYSFGVFGTTNGTDVTMNIGSNSVTQASYLGTITNHPFIFQTNSTERSRIDTSGNFLVGATSIPTGSSSFAAGNSIYVDGNLLIGNSGGTSTTFFRWDGYINSMYGLWNNGSTDTGVRLDSGSTSWAASSDERLKDIIEPITDATEKVSTLRAVIGKYKSDEPDKRRSFLIAQDVQAILPEAVSEGIAPNGTEAYLWLAYQDVIPLLVAAIKELNTRLEAVENK